MPGQKEYILQFEINHLPAMTNALRVHWRKVYKNAKVWKRRVWQCAWHLKPPEPLERAKLTLIRQSNVEPDTDGLVSGFKHIIDGLVEVGVLINDKPSNIGIPDYRWEKCKRGDGKVIIRVEALP